MPDVSVPVSVTTGFTWTSAGAWGTFLTLLALIVRQVGPWRKLRDDAEEKLRIALAERVDKLEKTLDRQTLRHEAERSLDRHKLNNLNQCFDAVMLLLETSPEKTPEILARVKAMRESQLKAEALEAAAIHAAQLVSDKRDADG